jgi:hypothetical protein
VVDRSSAADRSAAVDRYAEEDHSAAVDRSAVADRSSAAVRTAVVDRHAVAATDEPVPALQYRVVPAESVPSVATPLSGVDAAQKPADEPELLIGRCHPDRTKHSASSDVPEALPER